MIAFFEQMEIKPLNLFFILLETIMVKSLVIPLFLKKTRKQDKIARIDQIIIPEHYYLIFILSGIIFSFLLDNIII